MMKMLRYLAELGTAALILVVIVILCAALLPFEPPPKVCRLTGDTGPYPPWRCGEPSGW